MSRRNHRQQWLGLLGVVVVLLFVLLVSGRASAFSVPPPEGAVTDTTGILSFEEDASLERNIAAYRARTGNEIGVLVVPSTGGDPIKDAAFKTFNTWGVGKKGLDNGVLLVIVAMDHHTRIETGKGIEHRLTDAAAARILADDLAPDLRAGHFRDGIEKAILAIENELDKSAASVGTVPSPIPSLVTTVTTSPATTPKINELAISGHEREESDRSNHSFAWFFVIPLMGGLYVTALLANLRHRRRNREGGYGYGDSYDGSSSFASTSTDYFSGGGDGGGGGGGGGDFGGGSSGGGGADGSF